jgi:hypothetical protein
MCGFLNAGKTSHEREDETPMFQQKASLSQQEKNVYLLRNILWDVEPKQLIESSYRKTETASFPLPTFEL